MTKEKTFEAPNEPESTKGSATSFGETPARLVQRNKDNLVTEVRRDCTHAETLALETVPALRIHIITTMETLSPNGRETCICRAPAHGVHSPEYGQI